MKKWKKKSGSGNKEYWYMSIPGLNQEIRYSRWIVERIRRKVLPSKAVIHHVDEDSLYDYPSNLVVCEDDAYHKLLHLRTDALRATGNPHSRRCKICKQWGIPGEGDMVRLKRSARAKGDGTTRHRSCHTKEEKQRRQATV